MTSPVSGVSSWKRCRQLTASSRPSRASPCSHLRGLLQLYAVALARLRESSRLRHSLALWSLVGLITSEGFAIPVALLHGSESVVPAAAATLVWWLLVAVVVVGGAAIFTTPDGGSADRYGGPNGLPAVRAGFRVP